MVQAADNGVLLVSAGTIAQLGEPALSVPKQSLVHVRNFAQVLSPSQLHVSLCLTGIWLTHRDSVRHLLSCDAGHNQVVQMAAAFAKLPCKVLWRLTSSEIPDASAPFRLGRNTKVPTPAIPTCAYQVTEVLLMCK